MDNSWNPWKMTAIGMALVVVTAVITTVVVANWTGRQAEAPAVAAASPSMPLSAAAPQVTPGAPAAAPVLSPGAPPVIPPGAPPVLPPGAAPVLPPGAPAPTQPAPAAQAKPAPAVPSKVAINACNRYAASRPTTKDKTVEVVKDGLIGGAIGAAVGAAGGAIADGGKGAGTGAAIGGVVGITGGALYGLNENKKNDERYRQAYASCMRSRGYTG
jgi:hypothetical protein